MEKNLYIDASHPNETRIVLKSSNSIEEYEFEDKNNLTFKNNIYLGTISRVEPSLQAAFINFGRERHGFLAFNDIQSDYYQIPLEDKEKIKVAEENGYSHVINYTKNDFAKEVLKITNDKGVPAVFDGVGKETFYGSLACLKTRGMMISFGNASGPLDPVNVPKDIQPKGLYLTRPSIGQYFSNRKELQAGADQIFEKVKFGKIKIRISKKYKLSEAKNAHADLEARKLIGPAILIP